MTVQAERIEVDQATRVVTAYGDVILDQGPRRISGRSMTFDLDDKTGTFTDATAYVDPDYYFKGTEIAKVEEDVYTVENGVFTSCEGEVPPWSFSLKKARVRVGGYAKVRGAAMKVKKLPVFYTPYLLWPAKTERSSGLLIPQPGYSDRRGASLGLAYYQTLGRSYDTTFFADVSTEDYLGFGNEFRYRPNENTQGIFEGYIVRDPEQDDDWRWRVRLDHTSENLPFGMRAVIAHRDFSDFDYYRDFERDFSRGSLRVAPVSRLRLRKLGAALAQHPGREPGDLRFRHEHPRPAQAAGDRVPAAPDEARQVAPLPQGRQLRVRISTSSGRRHTPGSTGARI